MWTAPICASFGCPIHAPVRYIQSSDIDQQCSLSDALVELPALFLPHETKDGVKSIVLEVQTVAPPNPRSWFMPEGEVLKGT